MEKKFKLAKFHTSDSGFIQIRYEVLSSGKVIAFGVAGTDLSRLQFGGEIDFDKESDDLLEKYRDSLDNVALEYVPNIGFSEVDIAKQRWFIFA